MAQSDDRFPAPRPSATLTPSTGFNWARVAWFAPDEPVAMICSYCDTALADDATPLICWREDDWSAHFCASCQALWFGIRTFPDVPDDDHGHPDFPEDDFDVPDFGVPDSGVVDFGGVDFGADDASASEDDARENAAAARAAWPSLGPCCHCERDGARTILMLPVRNQVPGHGWGCFACDLPLDGASAVLCDDCAPLCALGTAPRFACRGYPATDGRVAFAELSEPFIHDFSRPH